MAGPISNPTSSSEAEMHLLRVLGCIIDQQGGSISVTKAELEEMDGRRVTAERLDNMPDTLFFTLEDK